MKYVNKKYGWEGEKICKGGKNMGNRVKYWMCIPTFVEKILVNGQKNVGSGGKNID